ncbi:iron-sulfur cluster scaffold-like protein [Philodulcilactobacillus myokoensis]|uniref:Iron-sulfur cluster scaffold-like protein n=1 Tax=Philodulcilactobacillus myokoensis TaxID=2929573 RepID=A0A9W6AZT5_9LACO|nr:SUF system NifU family Fe-S cluster assembly protein [Philodulcilactobacillus myokoensis]GLB46226.1 iron-sulfur cluster scaffold-like protein [Philodulcilactobacillus myokoensis]
MDIRSLYQDIILDNASHPQFQKRLSGTRIQKVLVNNPTCGDRLVINGIYQHHKLEAIYFHINGCIISKASTNMMAHLVIHHSIKQIDDLVLSFSKLMTNEDFANKDKLGDALSLSSVAKLPVRIKCAMLPWKGIYQLLHREVHHEN